ncbi:MAG: hypothetical protein AAGA91_02710 [Pseudomonadota bacterium]
MGSRFFTAERLLQESRIWPRGKAVVNIAITLPFLCAVILVMTLL